MHSKYDWLLVKLYQASICKYACANEILCRKKKSFSLEIQKTLKCQHFWRECKKISTEKKQFDYEWISISEIEIVDDKGERFDDKKCGEKEGTALISAFQVLKVLRGKVRGCPLSFRILKAHDNRADKLKINWKLKKESKKLKHFETKQILTNFHAKIL